MCFGEKKEREMIPRVFPKQLEKWSCYPRWGRWRGGVRVIRVQSEVVNSAQM